MCVCTRSTDAECVRVSAIPCVCRPGVAVACRAAITFTAHEQVGYGDKLCVVGNEKALGRWKLDKAFELRWSEGDIWEGQVEVPDDAKIEYKLVKLKGIGDPEWEDGDNRSLDRSASARTVVLVWNSERKTRVEEGTNSKKGTAPPRQDTSSGDDYSSGSDSYSSGADFDGDGSPTGAWRGKEVQFMRENAHSRERSGRWDTSGLEGTLLQVVQGDEKSGRCATNANRRFAPSVASPDASAPPRRVQLAAEAGRGQGCARRRLGQHAPGP